MEKTKYITISSDKKNLKLNVSSILYVLMSRNVASIYVLGDGVYKTRMTLAELETALGDTFIKIHRGCLVSVKGIHDITDKINLVNGESLEYAVRKKTEIQRLFQEKQKWIIGNFKKADIPKTEEEYREYYRSYEELPFAFTDIEMVFDESKRAVDWIFRYGNAELAKLERMPLEKLIGNSFGSLFHNMDSKWLRSYERTVLYGEKLEIIEYSPEVDRYLNILCFPTFQGHCGCILIDISEIEVVGEKEDSKNALIRYLANRMSTRPV